MNATHIPQCPSPWPALEYESWKTTYKTLHMWTQIVGKIRMALMPWQNHSWHVTFYITARGFSTGSIPYKNGILEMEFDFTRHQLIISSSFKHPVVVKLFPRSVADFYRELMQQLKDLVVEVNIYAAPNEVEVSIPFAENEQDTSYDQQKVADFWQVAVSTHNVFQHFRSDFIGKVSPVHFFWGAFDIALTRFSGRQAPLHQGEMPNMPREVMQEAYSREVSSCGFWPGSDQFPQPCYYSYAYPLPENYGKQPISPPEAFYSEEMGEFFLPYDLVRKSDQPRDMLMEFLTTTYDAAAITGQWDRSILEKQ
ncbi:MAG: DUF5996 family protein [Candidatus Cyclobacteriaceae bacterium M3_2C_046]